MGAWHPDDFNGRSYTISTVVIKSFLVIKTGSKNELFLVVNRVEQPCCITAGCLKDRVNPAKIFWGSTTISLVFYKFF